MNYIVMDLEWNQPAGYADMVKNPVFLTGELIQIGAVKLDQSFQVIGSFDERIAPQYYTKLHPTVAALTKLSDRDLRRGRSFQAVFDDFCDWCGCDFVFLIWGTEDLRILRKNMELHNIDTGYMPPCFNLQNIFAEQVSHDTKQYALGKALSLVHETPFEAHDALNDAKSTALLCKHMNILSGLNAYHAVVDQQNGIVETYLFEEPYDSISDALDDDFVVSFECPRCGKIVWGDHWVLKGKTMLLSLGQCSDGQEYLIKLKFRPTTEGIVLIKRLVYELTDALRADYEKCAERTALWRQYVISSLSF